MLVALAALLVRGGSVLAAADNAVAGQGLQAGAAPLEQVQKYERAIHVMAMLLLGFGLLMVFVKRYGRSALTATYLLVALSVPMYFLLNAAGVFGAAEHLDIDRLMMAEFAGASLLICAGAATSGCSCSPSRRGSFRV